MDEGAGEDRTNSRQGPRASNLLHLSDRILRKVISASDGRATMAATGSIEVRELWRLEIVPPNLFEIASAAHVEHPGSCLSCVTKRSLITSRRCFRDELDWKSERVRSFRRDDGEKEETNLCCTNLENDTA